MGCGGEITSELEQLAVRAVEAERRANDGVQERHPIKKTLARVAIAQLMYAMMKAGYRGIPSTPLECLEAIRGGMNYQI